MALFFSKVGDQNVSKDIPLTRDTTWISMAKYLECYYVWTEEEDQAIDEKYVV